MRHFTVGHKMSAGMDKESERAGEASGRVTAKQPHGVSVSSAVASSSKPASTPRIVFR